MKPVRSACAGILSILLSGCSLSQHLPQSGSGTLQDFLNTASGFVLEAGKQAAATVELGKMGVQKGKAVMDDLGQRADDVQKGIESVKKGKELIEKGIGTK